MTKVRETRGYTFSQMRGAVLSELHKPLTQRNLAALIRIFVPEVSPLWSEQTVLTKLYKSIKECEEPHDIEEAARILIDCSYWWDEQSERYLEYGTDNNEW